jgi:hypothetical protein
MKIRRPRGRVWRFLCTPSPYDAIIAAFAVGNGGIAYVGLVHDHHPRRAIGLAVITAGVFVLGLAKTFLSWREQGRKETLHDLAGCLHTLLAVLTFAAEAAYAQEHADDDDAAPFTDPRLRITVLIPIDDGQDLEQVLNYVGDGRGGSTVGRVFPAQSGIAGRAFREKAPWKGTRSRTETTYVQELVKRWQYTEADARARDQESLSWMAIPLVDENTKRVEAIVFLDAVSEDLFTGFVKDLALNACAGIALFASLRYD